MKTYKFPLFVVALLIVLLSACASRSEATMSSGPAMGELPVDKAYAEGKEVYIAHTEVSSADVAKKMEAIMKSPVLAVPSLASVPQDALANVYAFTNGVEGEGMSGFQVSVFDNPPGTPGYTPLRRMNMVTWVDGAKARELKSAAEVLEATKAGEVNIEQTPVVINMPFIVWDGGKR